MEGTSGERGIHVLVVASSVGNGGQIEAHFPESSSFRITTERTVSGALEKLEDSDTIECVVSEYALSDVDGVAFLKAVRMQYSDLPFILLIDENDHSRVGTVETLEQVAARAVSAGVTEFLTNGQSQLEERWDHLPALIEDTVAYYRTRVALVDLDARVKICLDQFPDPIVVVRDRKVVYSNDAGVDLLGNVVGSEFVRRIGRSERSRLYSIVSELECGERTVECLDAAMIGSDGETVPVVVTATRITWEEEPTVFLLVRDVSERNERRLLLRQYRRAVEQAGHAMYITELDGTITYVNPAFEEVTGFTSDDAIGKTPTILKSGEMPDGYYEALWSSVLDGEVWEEEVINRRKDGELYTAHQTIAPIHGPDGRTEGFVAIQTDVTERAELEHTLSTYERIVERLEDPILLQDLEGRFRLINEAVCTHSGREESELLGRNEYAFMDEETAATIGEWKTRVLQTEEPVSYEVTPTFSENGTEHTFSTYRYPYYDGQGNLAGTMAICRNVTDLKTRESRLRQYERAVEGAYDLIAAADTTGHFIFANEQYCEYHDVDRDDLHELTVEDVTDESEFAIASEFIDRTLEGEVVQYRTVRGHPTRGPRTLDVRYYPLDGRNGEVSGVISIMRDVTEQAERERQLRVVDRVLRHNLRNDLTVIKGWAEEIQAVASGNIEAAATEIVESATQLSTTGGKSRDITEFLGKPPQHERIDIEQVIDGVVATLRSEYPHARIESSIPESPITVATPRLERAIEELARNAVVHHDRSDPRVLVKVETDDEAIRISVEDDGPGIPEMDRDVLESGRETDDLYHGSGLGLWLVYWIVSRSGGSVTVSDAKVRGTIVTIELPHATQTES